MGGGSERRIQLAADLDASPEGPTHHELEALRHRVQKVIADGDTGAQKQLLYALVHEVRAAARSDIQPIFKIPSSSQPPDPKVRKLTGPAHPALHNANLSALLPGTAIVLPAPHAKVRRDGYRRSGA
jgi:hypothetical protein